MYLVYYSTLLCLGSIFVMRQKISLLIRTLLVVFHCSGVMQHMLLWYTNKVQNQTLKKPTTNIVVKEAAGLAAVFRDTCALIWLLHVREKLSVAVRNFEDMRSKGEPLQDVIEECLLWTSRIKPFACYLSCEFELENLVVCLCSARVVDHGLVSILAYYFCDVDNISPKIQSRLEPLLQKLRQTFVYANSQHQGLKTNSSEQGYLPLSVLYQKQCIKMFQKQKRNSSLKHLFVTNNTSLLKYDLSSLETMFIFESDVCYQSFITNLFSIITEKSDSLTRNLTRGGINNYPTKILVCKNRHEIALNELKKAMTLSHEQNYTPSSTAQDVEAIVMSLPGFVSTPMKQTSMMCHMNLMNHYKHQNHICKQHKMDSSIKMSQVLDFAQLLPSDLQAYGDDFVSGILSRVYGCMKFDVNDVLPAMKKRFCRLLPFITWLHYWMYKDVVCNDSSSMKPAMRVEVSGQQLLQSLFIAEIRFKKYLSPAFNQVMSTQSSSNDLDFETPKFNGIKDAKKVSIVHVNLF